MINRKVISGKGYTYLITRRIVQRKTETVLRVRVRAYEGLLTSGTPVENEYRDYVHVAEGDQKFHSFIKQYQKHVNG